MYAYADHTGDVKIIAEGETFKEALGETAKALIEVMNDHATKRAKPNVSVEGEKEGERNEDLVVNFLNSIISRSESEGLIPSSVEIVEVGERSIKYKLWGEKGTPSNIVKAATYHQLSIKNEQGKWRIEVVLDV